MNLESSDEEIEHEPVLLNEVIQVLDPKPGGTYVDCTVGAGGHAAAILLKAGGSATLIGIDRDEIAVRQCRRRLDKCRGKVEIFRDRFENLGGVLADRKANGIIMDLGLSSRMLDNPERGFSFQSDGPLDMRMDRNQSLTAADIVNGYSKEELATIFRTYGEERFAKRIAAGIVRERTIEPIKTTLQLADIIRSASPPSSSRIHPATRVFMALRIMVNGELEHLGSAIETAIEHLVPGGRLAVISFHSLEDRIVKQTFVSLAKGCVCPPRVPICVCGRTPSVSLLFKKPVKPGGEEIKRNRRSRSALLRAVERVAA